MEGSNPASGTGIVKMTGKKLKKKVSSFHKDLAIGATTVNRTTLSRITLGIKSASQHSVSSVINALPD
jgi:hypothetical protein